MKRDGTLLAGQIAEADPTSIRLRHAGAPQSVIAADAAWLILRPLNDEMLAKLKAARGGGVLMRSGDFIEGELKSLDADRVRLNSVLFGARDFPAGREALAVVLRPCRPGGRFQVWLKDGSVLRCDALKVAGDRLELGGAAVGLADVARLRLDP